MTAFRLAGGHGGCRFRPALIAATTGAALLALDTKLQTAARGLGLELVEM